MVMYGITHCWHRRGGIRNEAMAELLNYPGPLVSDARPPSSRVSMAPLSKSCRRCKTASLGLAAVAKLCSMSSKILEVVKDSR